MQMQQIYFICAAGTIVLVQIGPNTSLSYIQYNLNFVQLFLELSSVFGVFH